jgi:hypothetical protein
MHQSEAEPLQEVVDKVYGCHASELPRYQCEWFAPLSLSGRYCLVHDHV